MSCIGREDENISPQLYRASQDYIYRKIADTYVLIAVGGNIANFNGYVSINETAAVLWERLQTPSTAETLQQVLVEKYGIDRRQAAKDVQDFLDEMIQHDMVEVIRDG